MRRSTPFLAVLVLVVVVACGGDDDEDEASPSTTAGDETTTTTEAPGSETESESEGSGSQSADAYAEGVCGSISAWYDDIDTASTALVEDAGSLTDEDPAAGKELVLGFLDDAIGFTDGLITDLQGAGVPDTETGAETADDLVAGIEDVRSLFQGARDDTAALPADDPQALATGLQDIGTALQESATAVGANFEAVLSSVEDPELSDAFESAPSCQGLATIS